MNLVIPEAIEPRQGYKALNYSSDGRLFSPSKRMAWPSREKLEATCLNIQWGWCLVESEPRPLSGSVWARSVQPTNPLPQGWLWSWEPILHDVPSEACGCGCYIVDCPLDCLPYLNKNYGIIVEIALWGRVIPASKGARGQYAYPQRVLAPTALLSEVQPISLLYGIPVLVLDEEQPVVRSRTNPNPFANPFFRAWQGNKTYPRANR